MSKKTSRRRRAPPVSGRRQTFTLVIEAQTMVVSYKPRWMADMAKFEFRSPHKPPQRIPVSETGYRCYFAPMEEVETAKSPQAFAREAALSMLPWLNTAKQDRCGELPLFV